MSRRLVEGDAEVTVRVPLEEAIDLLEAPGRACLSFAVEGRPQVEPVEFRYERGRFLVGLDDRSKQLADAAEVVLMVDEGTLFFHLRGVYARGEATAIVPPPGDQRSWFEVEPSRVSSWDYGRMRVGREPR